MDLKDLRKPFPVNLIQWKPQSVNKDRGSALAVPYIDARAVEGRLDDVAGPESWADSYHVVEYEGKLRMACSLSIYCGPERGWVAKVGFGEPPEGQQIDEGKGAESDALKRAAVKWGIGRYIYAFPKQWVDAEFSANGKFKRFKVAPKVPDWAHPRAGPVSTENEALPESDEDGDEPKEVVIDLTGWNPANTGEVKDKWIEVGHTLKYVAGSQPKGTEAATLIKAIGDPYAKLDSAKPEELRDLGVQGVENMKKAKE